MTLERESRMFEWQGQPLKTWNPWMGCRHKCYGDGCWACKRIAHRFGARFNCTQCYEFKPHLHEERLQRIPSDPQIFVVAHGDLFGDWVPREVIERILAVCRKTPKKLWFFESKNPKRYLEFLFPENLFPVNTMLSTTIETNREYPETIRGYTPPPIERFAFMLAIKNLTAIPLHISIEPIMDFDPETLLFWMRLLHPQKIAVGYDSLNNKLPEPSREKTEKLIKVLKLLGNDVERKQL